MLGMDSNAHTAGILPLLMAALDTSRDAAEAAASFIGELLSKAIAGASNICAPSADSDASCLTVVPFAAAPCSHATVGWCCSRQLALGSRYPR